MTSPIIFGPTTPGVGLPLLIPGQAQKEFFINQALGILDAMLPSIVLASQSAPPSSANNGDCYRVTAMGAQAWEGCDDHIAVRIGDDWHFIPPQEGMRIFDAEAGYLLVFRAAWQRADAPTPPVSGAVIDAEARATLEQLIQALRSVGILA